MTLETGHPRISVVSPLYRSGATVERLVQRITTALQGESFEIVLVDDASPDDTLERARGCTRVPHVRLLALSRNSGQHRAVLAGFAASRGDWLVSLDADLQDPPEAIPDLLRFAKKGAFEAVFAGRVGGYQSLRRHISSRLFKICLALAAGVPRDAGMYFILSREAFERVRVWDGKRAFVLAMIGLSGVSIGTLPVRRSLRGAGSSSYEAVDRWRVGGAAITFALRSRWRGPGREEPVGLQIREITNG